MCNSMFFDEKWHYLLSLLAGLEDRRHKTLHVEMIRDGSENYVYFDFIKHFAE
jgi:hypothetical protein